jgi:hypothetical protein
MIETFKIGDLVRPDRLWHRHELGVVVQIFHEGSANEGLRVRMVNGDISVAPSDEWTKP